MTLSRTKQLAFLQDFIIPNHPMFKNDKKLRKMAMENPDWFNVEYLYEETHNLLSGYTKTSSKTAIVDATKGNKKIEYKTGTVYDIPTSKSQNSYRMVITAIESNAGVIKTASIKASVFNKVLDKIEHFLIPQKDLASLRNSAGAKGKGMIVGSYNPVKDSYGTKMEKYRISLDKMVMV